MATAVLAQYFVAQPFNWHGISSSAPYFIPWPATGKLRGDPIVNIPYPTPTSQLCDSDADCPAGVKCLTGSSPAVCASTTPSPNPAPPSPPAVPSPPPGPPAATCNVTGNWIQPHTSVSLHSDDASINMTMLGGGSFGFTCTSKHSPSLCPFGQNPLSGTGQLSSTGNTVTLTPTQAGTSPITAIIPNTFTCGEMLLPSANVTWQFQPPARTPTFNMDVTQATYLAVNTDEGTSFVGTGVAVPADGFVLVSGNGQATWAGARVITVLGASAASNGTLLLLSTDTSKPRGSGSTVLAVIKVGDRVDQVRVNKAGQVAIAGSFGVAVLTGLSTTSPAPAVAWQDKLEGVEPGDCGVCCSSNGQTTCRVDIGLDGTVIADVAVSGPHGALWSAWTPTGTRFAHGIVHNAASLDSIAVDSANRHLLVGWFYNSNTGKEPMVMPRVAYYSYTPGSTAEPVLDFVNFPWDAHVYRTPGQPCNGDVADGRVMGMRLGLDGTLLWMGRSDGGDSPFYCGLRDSNRTTPFVGIDGFNSPYNMQAQAITNFLRVDAALGETIVGTQILTRVPSKNSGNTLLTLAGQSDDAGNVYLLQNAACCIANMDNLTVNGQALAGPTDAAVLHILNPDLTVRYHWTHFIAPASPKSGGVPIDIDIRGGTVAALFNMVGPMVQAGAWAGTGPAAGNQQVAYLVILPTV